MADIGTTSKNNTKAGVSPNSETTTQTVLGVGPIQENPNCLRSLRMSPLADSLLGINVMEIPAKRVYSGMCGSNSVEAEGK